MHAPYEAYAPVYRLRSVRSMQGSTEPRVGYNFLKRSCIIAVFGFHRIALLLKPAEML